MAEEFKPVTLVKGERAKTANTPAEFVAATFDGYTVKEESKQVSEGSETPDE